jgi:uncharacterized protein (DUF433 family)
VRADIDNIIKPTLDALKDVVYNDDRQLRSVRATLFDRNKENIVFGRVEQRGRLFYSPEKDVILISIYSDSRLQELGGERSMSEPITEVVNGELYQYYPLGEYVMRAVGVCGGRPTFKYTRIEIAGALDRLAAGESLDEIVAGYRGRVSREAVMEAIQVVTSGFLNTLPALEPA